MGKRRGLTTLLLLLLMMMMMMMMMRMRMRMMTMMQIYSFDGNFSLDYYQVEDGLRPVAMARLPGKEDLLVLERFWSAATGPPPPPAHSRLPRLYLSCSCSCSCFRSCSCSSCSILSSGALTPCSSCCSTLAVPPRHDSGQLSLPLLPTCLTSKSRKHPKDSAS